MHPDSAPADDAENLRDATFQREDGRGLPLAGVRVLELCQVVAGPFCCMLLGDMGADVIKIEPPGGDQTRRMQGFKQKGADGLGFMNLNRNKRSIVLDLKTTAGRDVLYKLARSADILVENNRPGVTRRLGIDQQTLRAINPRLIYASISGFGQTGPWADRPGYDLIAQAMAGIMSITGSPGQPPVKAGVPVADVGCSLLSLYGILCAYINRLTTGVGQYVDASLFESAMAFAFWEASEYWGTGRVPKPLGTAHRTSAPYEAVKARDQLFVVGVNNQRLWKLFCEVIRRPDLAKDARFAEGAARLANRARLIEEIEISLATRTAEDWIERLLQAGVPAGPILDVSQALASEHARERGMVMDIEHSVEGSVRSLGFPVKFSHTPPQLRRPPPLLGEHTAEVLRELSLTEAVIEAFSSQGALQS
jgi:crotonobetainyl-CoA:carnitine CoA-transferase CaiB-like acyl-CoA transferase